MATHSSILAWRIPWKRSLVGYSPWGPTESDMNEATKHSTARGKDILRYAARKGWQRQFLQLKVKLKMN